MRRLDYNKVMCILGVILIVLFCIFLIKDYMNYDNINNSTNFYIIMLLRIVEFWIPGLLLVCLYNQNTSVKTSEYVVNFKNLPGKFKGYKIAHISDFHNTNSKRIVTGIKESLEKNKPDIIVITGDLIDSRRTNFMTACNFIKIIRHIAPIYYVLGNHESRLENIKVLEDKLKKLNVNILRNEIIELEKEKQKIELLGLDDLAFYVTPEEYYNKELVSKHVEFELEKLVRRNDSFKLLLVHRPELLDIYSNFSVDLIFSGHAHGGQIRLPFVGGIIAPGQGFFPKYTKGIHEMNNTKMLISRGIGNSGFPFRVNNRPELVIVTLDK